MTSGATGPSTNDTEGVTKFTLQYVPAEPVAPALLATLNAWRTVLHRLGLTARDPARYEGLAYGNVSRRMPQSSGKPSLPQFLISGTQTGGLPMLDERHYSLVVACDLHLNRVTARGPIPPSSEALTHAAAYASDSRIQCVLHVHSPEIWNCRSILRLPTVPASVSYGTPQMATAIAALLARRCEPVIAMAGHRDGIVSVGVSVDEAAKRLIATLARALEVCTTATSG